VLKSPTSPNTGIEFKPVAKSEAAAEAGWESRSAKKANNSINFTSPEDPLLSSSDETIGVAKSHSQSEFRATDSSGFWSSYDSAR
jgi:hypothetical protein